MAENDRWNCENDRQDQSPACERKRQPRNQAFIFSIYVGCHSYRFCRAIYKMSRAYGWRASCVSPGEALRSRPAGGVTAVVVGHGAWFGRFAFNFIWSALLSFSTPGTRKSELLRPIRHRVTSSMRPDSNPNASNGNCHTYKSQYRLAPNRNGIAVP